MVNEPASTALLPRVKPERVNVRAVAAGNTATVTVNIFLVVMELASVRTAAETAAALPTWPATQVAVPLKKPAG